VNECCHKMKRDSSQTIFQFLLKDMEVIFKLKRYIFKFHLFRFQFSMHLKFCIIYNWKSYVLFRFELWYHVLLRLLHVMFFGCVCGACGQYDHEAKKIGISNKVHVQIQTYIVVVFF